MNRILIIVVIAGMLLTSCSHSYYIVRHAEKATQSANMSSDVPLTEQGTQRAVALKNILQNKKIGEVYSTNTIRTRSTAQPTADYFHLAIQTYGPMPDTGFIRLLRSTKKNVLIVGHSNTVDDIVNMLCGVKKVQGDLADTEYSKLFVVKRKGKKSYFFERSIPAQ